MGLFDLNHRVLHTDIAGFTAWSSTREPVQVFQLLEAIYACFDKIAERRGVYKVETIGDCYGKVCTGLDELLSIHCLIHHISQSPLSVFQNHVRTMVSTACSEGDF